MRKLFVLALMAMFVLNTSFAQEGATVDGISFGAKAGVNFASLTGDETDDLDGRTGILGGAVVNIPVSELFSVQPEVIYSAQGFTIEEMDSGMTFKGTGRIDYINVPILADFTVAEGFSLQGGPQLGFLVKDELEFDDVPGTEDLEAESFDFSAALGAQYRLPMGLFFQARYTIGLTNIAGDDADGEVQNAVFSLAAGWFFN